ncbi:hypothetical protein [Streptomyces sp. NBC_00076]|uniref:hypothetical protein n=1 Tax=Streptomyces sp. NBC_00076 TaxID=2975642 RepID=UPI003245D8FB
MTYTLADAIRAQFERTHPGGKNTLLCDQCRRRKDRKDFRETPWHGRAADCKSCEGMRWVDELRLRQTWELEQERAKVVMLIRHIQRLRLQRIIPRDVRTFQTWAGDVIRTMPEPERRRKRARLTLKMERKR